MSDASPALLALLRELPSLRLPPRAGLTPEAWLAACRPLVPRDTWVRLALAVL